MTVRPWWVGLSKVMPTRRIFCAWCRLKFGRVTARRRGGVFAAAVAEVTGLSVAWLGAAVAEVAWISVAVVEVVCGSVWD